MGQIDLDDKNGLYFQWTPPTQKGAPSFVFFNALTGDHEAWEAYIGPECRGAGYGTLVFNYRGQTGSPFSADLRLDDKLIVADTLRLLEVIKPPRAILVGLSIGGLFAARVVLEGFQAAGLVLINTLRRDGPRLKWIWGRAGPSGPGRWIGAAARPLSTPFDERGMARGKPEQLSGRDRLYRA